MAMLTVLVYVGYLAIFVHTVLAGHTNTLDVVGKLLYGDINKNSTMQCGIAPEDHEFACDIETIEWRYGMKGQPICKWNYGNKRNKCTTRGRLSGFFETHRRTHYLVISETQSLDGGWYMCKIKTTCGTTGSDAVLLTFSGDGNEAASAIARSVYGEYGGLSILRCEAPLGINITFVEWWSMTKKEMIYLDSPIHNPFSGMKGRLSSRSVQSYFNNLDSVHEIHIQYTGPDDMEWYLCRIMAGNDFYEDKVNHRISGNHFGEKRDLRMNKTCIRGQRVTLYCTGNPSSVAVRVVWERSKQYLEKAGNTRSSKLYDHFNGHITLHSIPVNKCDESDEGWYTCTIFIGSNVYSKTSIRLFVTGTTTGKTKKKQFSLMELVIPISVLSATLCVLVILISIKLCPWRFRRRAHIDAARQTQAQSAVEGERSTDPLVDGPAG